MSLDVEGDHSQCPDDYLVVDRPPQHSPGGWIDPPPVKAGALDVQIGGAHYKNFTIQPVEFIEKNSLSFLEGCIIKRICRHGAKNGVEDLLKAKHEIDLLIELRYGALK